MKFKRGLSVLLCMLLCVGLMPTTASAADEYKVLVGGVWITSDNADDVFGDGGSVTYDPVNNTVTLNNAKLTSNIYSNTGSALNIVVNGTNTIECTGTIATGISNYGNNPINISGAGKLTITVDIAKGNAISGNNVVIDGTELELHTSGEAISGYPLTIQNGANVTAILSEGSGSVAINAGEMKVIGGSTLTATSPRGNSIIADGLEIGDNSTVRGTGYYPIKIYGDITITDSTVTGESTADWGIWATGNLTIKGKSDVTATGSMAALGAVGSFTLEPPAGELMDVFVGADAENASAIEGSPLSQTTDLSAYGNTNIKYFHSAPHVHAYDRQVTDDQYQVEPASCEQAARYYYSCACGETGTDTFESGAPNGHSFQDGRCTVCGDIDPDFNPVITAGADGEWQKGSKDGLSFTSNAAFADFVKVQVDGNDLDAADYEVREGSTIVTLKASYLETLSGGRHTLSIVSDTGTATTGFTIKEVSAGAAAATDDTIHSAKTGDDSNIAFWFFLLLAAGTAMAGVVLYSRQKKYN